MYCCAVQVQRRDRSVCITVELIHSCVITAEAALCWQILRKLAQGSAAVLMALYSGCLTRIVSGGLWPDGLWGLTFCCVSTHEAKLEVAITAGTFLILIYTKIDLFRNISDFRNLFRDGQSPHCTLRVFITSCRVHSTNVLYQCYISLHTPTEHLISQSAHVEF